MKTEPVEMMSTSTRKFPFRSAYLLLAALVLSSCATKSKPVEPYQDRSKRQPVYTRQAAADQAPSKSLPEVQSVRSEQRDRTTDRADRSAEPSATRTLLPALTMVDERIITYEDKLAAWNEFVAQTAEINLTEELQEKMQTCQVRLMDILDGYNDLHEGLFMRSRDQQEKASLHERLLAVEREDIGFLESDCQQILMENKQSGRWVEGTRYKLLEEREKEIQSATKAQDFQEVITLYEQLPLEEGQYPSFDTSYSYGQALLKTGREKEAEALYLELLDRVQKQNQVEREFYLMRLIADINFGLEEYSRAFERYIDIINRYAGLGENVEWARSQQEVIGYREANSMEVRAFASLMLAYLSYNAERDGYKVVLTGEYFRDNYPDSAMMPTVNRILIETRDKADAWFAGILAQLDMLRAEEKYDEALLLVEQLPRREMPFEKQDHLNSIVDELVSAQFEEAENRRLALEEELKLSWNRSLELLRAKEYDQAIELFESLLGSQYDERAR